MTSVKRQPRTQHSPANRQERFERLDIRLYGAAEDVAIATGIVAATLPGGHQDRTVFTDVFVLRNRRWQAVNAQENPIQTPAPAP